MVLALCHLTGRNSTVPPKSVPSITSFEANNLSMGSLVIAGLPHPPKEKYSLAGPQHPLKVKYFLSAVLTVLQGGKEDGDTHTIRHDPQDGLEC